MAKTNFSKVEDILSRGLHKISVNKLLELADLAASIGAEEKTQSAKQKLEQTKVLRQRHFWISTIKRDLSWLEKNNQDVYKHLNLKKKDVLTTINAPDQLDDAEWEHVKVLFEKIEGYKEEVRKKHPAESEEEIIEAERLKHINKRFNVSEKWLPLD